MGLIQVKTMPSASQKEYGYICYHLNIGGKQKIISTDYQISVKEWNQNLQTIVIGKFQSKERTSYLISLQHKIEKDLELFEKLLSNENINFTKIAEEKFFFGYSYQLIHSLKEKGKFRTAATYQTALSSFQKFIGKNDDVYLQSINKDLMLNYENYLFSCGICANSSSFYMRNLRAIYNRAVEFGLTEQRHPFKYVYTGVGKTAKRAISLKAFRLIKNFNPGADINMEFAKDIFLFSFYTRGMSFVDIAYLRKDNLQNGILTYQRRKTKQTLTIKWEKQMQAIIDKYNNLKSPFLLPIIKKADKDFWLQYKSAEHLVNKKLKIIGERIGLNIPLTTYVARHSWASIAKSKNVPISIISEAMGHHSEATTRIYLATLNTSAIDEANKSILDIL